MNATQRAGLRWAAAAALAILGTAGVPGCNDSPLSEPVNNVGPDTDAGTRTPQGAGPQDRVGVPGEATDGGTP